MTKFYDLLLSDLRSLKNSFSRLLGLILLFTLIGHFFMVEPYFGYKNEQQTLYSELNVSKNELQKVDGQLKKLQDVDKHAYLALNKIKKEIKDFPTNLRNMLPMIKESISASTSLQHQQSKPLLELPSDIKTFEKGVQWYTKQWFTKTRGKLKSDVFVPVMLLETESQEATKEKLQQLSQKAMKEISDYMDGIDPNFWHTFTEKTVVAKNLNKVVEQAFKPIYAEIKKLTKEIKNITTSHKEKLESIKENIKKTEEIETDLKNRVDNLQSPIGKIPVSLTDFIKLFPLLITILMVMVTLHLSRSRRLYAALQENMAKQEDDADKTAFSCVIDCWYLPPYLNILQPLLLAAAITVITAVFIRSVFLVTVNPELFLSLTGKEETLQWYLYMVSYLLGALAILGCLWFIRKSASSQAAKH